VDFLLLGQFAISYFSQTGGVAMSGGMAVACDAAPRTQPVLPDNPRRLLRRISLDVFKKTVIPQWTAASRRLAEEEARRPTTASSSSPTSAATGSLSLRISSAEPEIAAARMESLKRLNRDCEARARLDQIVSKATRDALGPLCFESKFAAGSCGGGSSSSLSDYRVRKEEFVELLLQPVYDGLLFEAAVTVDSSGGGRPRRGSAVGEALHRRPASAAGCSAQYLEQIQTALLQLFRAVDAAESGYVSLDRFVEFYMDTEEDMDRWSLAGAQRLQRVAREQGGTASTATPNTVHVATAVVKEAPAALAASEGVFPDIRFFVQNVSSQMLADARDNFERKRRDVERRFAEKLLLERGSGSDVTVDPLSSEGGNTRSESPDSRRHGSESKRTDGPATLRLNRDIGSGGDVAVLFVSMHPLALFAAGFRSGTVRYVNSDTYDVNELIKPCELKSAITAMCFAHGRRLTTAVPGMNAFSSYLVACCGDLSLRVIPSRRLSTFTSHPIPEVMVSVVYDPCRKLIVGGGRSGSLLVWVVSAKGFVSMLRRIAVTTIKHDILLSMVYIADPTQNLMVGGTQEGKVLLVHLQEEPALHVGELAAEVEAFQTVASSGAVDVPSMVARRIDVFHHEGPVQTVAYSSALRMIVGASFGRILCFSRDAVRSQPFSLVDDPAQQCRRVAFLTVERSGGFVISSDDTGLLRMWSLNSMDQVDVRDVIYGGLVGGDAASGSSGGGGGASRSSAKSGLDTVLSGYYNAEENAVLLNTTSVAVLVRLQTKTALAAGALLVYPSNDVLLLCLHPTTASVIVIVTALEVVLVNAADQSRLFSSSIGDYYLTHEAISCAVLSRSGSRVILGSISGECVAARLDTGRVVRRVEMPSRCGAVCSLSYGFGGGVEQNQLLCVTSRNYVVIFNDYGGNIFDVVVPVKVLHHDRLFACKVTSVPSPSLCYVILDWSFYVHTGGWEAGGKQFALKPVSRCRGKAGTLDDEEDEAIAAARNKSEMLDGVASSPIDAVPLSCPALAAKDRVIPPSDQISCVLSLHSFGLLLVVCATTTGSLVVFALPPHSLESKSMCSWRNRGFAYRAFCSDDPLTQQRRRHRAGNPQGHVDTQDNAESANAPVVEVIVFVPPYTLATVDDKDQLVLWDISDVILQSRPTAKQDSRLSTPNQPRFSTYFHRVSRPPFVKIVAWTPLPRPATSMLFIGPCCLLLLDGCGIPMVFRIDVRGLTKVASVPAALQAPAACESLVVHRARFRIRQVVTTAKIEQDAHSASAEFFKKLAVKTPGENANLVTVENDTSDNASYSRGGDQVKRSRGNNRAAIIRRWRHVFHVLRITWLLQKYIAYGAQGQPPVEAAASSGRQRSPRSSQTKDALDSNSEAEDDINRHQNVSRSAAASSFATSTSSSAAPQQRKERPKQPFPFTSDRALIIRMDADFGAPNHRCLDLDWALDLTCAEEDQTDGSSAAEDDEASEASMMSASRRRSSFGSERPGTESPREGGSTGFAKLRRRAFVAHDKVAAQRKHAMPIAKGLLRVPAGSESGGINTTSPAEQLHGASRALREALDSVHDREVLFAKNQKAEESDLCTLGLANSVVERDEGNHLLVKSAKLVKLNKSRRMSLVAEKTGAMLEGDCGVFDPRAAASSSPRMQARASSSSGSEDDEAPSGADIRFREVRRLSLSEQLQSVVKQSDTLNDLERTAMRRRQSGVGLLALETQENMMQKSTFSLSSSENRRSSVAKSAPLHRSLSAQGHSRQPEPVCGGSLSPAQLLLRVGASGLVGQRKGDERRGFPAEAGSSRAESSATIVITSQSVPQPSRSLATAGVSVWLVPTTNINDSNHQQSAIADDTSDNDDDVTAQEIFAMLREDAHTRAERLEDIARGQKKRVDRLRLPSSDPMRHVCARVEPPKDLTRPRPRSANGQQRRFQ
jgi:hypothetical protein